MPILWQSIKRDGVVVAARDFQLVGTTEIEPSCSGKLRFQFSGDEDGVVVSWSSSEILC